MQEHSRENEKETSKRIFKFEMRLSKEKVKDMRLVIPEELARAHFHLMPDRR